MCHQDLDKKSQLSWSSKSGLDLKNRNIEKQHPDIWKIHLDIFKSDQFQPKKSHQYHQRHQHKKSLQSSFHPQHPLKYTQYQRFRLLLTL